MSSDASSIDHDAGESAQAAGSPLLSVMAGTVVMGLSGLVVLVVAASGFGAADYALFGVFWAALYFVVAVVAGAQHESTRASVASHGADPGGSSLVVFAVSLASVLFVVVAGSSVWWADAAFGPGHHQLGVLAGVGSAGYALTCVFAGALAGSGRWGAFASLLIVEGVARAAAVIVVMQALGGVDLLAWVVVLAYPVTLAVVVPVTLRSGPVPGRVTTSLRGLWAHTSQTMVASAGVGALVTGFPFLISSMARDESRATVGALTLALMLTRAPLLVPLTGMQSLLVTEFARSDRARLWSLLGRLVAGAAALAVALSVAAGAIGASILTSVFGEDFAVRPPVLALLVVSSGFLAAMALASPALIARRSFTANAVAWVVASVVAVLVMAFAPWSLGWRAGASLVAGPLVGVAVQLVALRQVDRDRAPSMPA